ncbi:MAG TPA: hypothetical protein VHK24_00225 [Steroidobacter sp.]|jgi:hypothetical protein|nr:hypothetical protein [Steroidobacter sp.]
MIHRPLAICLLFFCATAYADYAASPKRPIDLSGYWTLNVAASDDPEQMLTERLQEERRRRLRERRAEELFRPLGAPPAIEIEAPESPSQLRPWQKQRQENFRRMLGVTETLHIRQEGSTVTIASAVETRRLTAGASSQVSMPEGQLADSRVGWDGEWFVIERKVRGGPGVRERFRLLKNGALEYLMAWSGDTELAGIKVRRVFDRRAASSEAPNADGGPVR